MISALIASALYAATYLSFTYLLRYPRNWCLPNLTASLSTGGLVALTVVLASWSPADFDYLVLALTPSFIVVLSIIVAAPVITFQPALRLIEFPAKHCDHAGLWLLAPVLVAALVTSDVELHAVLTTAMAIELTWFLRERWPNRQRRLLALSDNDLSVLETQAMGDLPAFQRRHAIRELMLSEGRVSWKGCGKRTPPCPFNLYVNRLGLNTAPCCREHMKELTRHVAGCLVNIGAVHWLEGGTLLGAIREQGIFLDWKDDVDISVLLDSDITCEQLATGLAERGARDGFFVDTFERKGFISISFDPPKRWPFRWERAR